LAFHPDISQYCYNGGMSHSKDQSPLSAVLSLVLAGGLILGTLGLSYYIQTEIFHQSFSLGWDKSTASPRPIPSITPLSSLAPLPSPSIIPLASPKPKASPKVLISPPPLAMLDSYEIPNYTMLRAPSIINGDYAHMDFSQFNFQFGFPSTAGLYQETGTYNQTIFMDVIRLDENHNKYEVGRIFAVKNGPTSELVGVDESTTYQKVGKYRWKIVVYTDPPATYAMFLKAADGTLYSFGFPNVTNYNQLTPEQKYMVESFEIFTD
jgi:hypothetical protein